MREPDAPDTLDTTSTTSTLPDAAPATIDNEAPATSLDEADAFEDDAHEQEPATDVEEEAASTEAPQVILDEAPSSEDGTPEEEPEREEDAPGAPTAEALPALLEALLFVSDGPVEERALARALGVPARRIGPALEELRTRLEGGGLIVQSGPDGAQLLTAPSAAAYVEAFLGLEQGRRLSNAALEALAIVAYRQPVTRATIEAIRGVSSEGAVQTLRARGLIEEAGRAQGPGRPTLFVTTQRFLEHFGLQRPGELPELGDYQLPPPDAAMPMPEGAGPAGPQGPEGGEASGGTAEALVAERLVELTRAAHGLAEVAVVLESDERLEEADRGEAVAEPLRTADGLEDAGGASADAPGVRDEAAKRDAGEASWPE